MKALLKTDLGLLDEGDSPRGALRLI